LNVSYRFVGFFIPQRVVLSIMGFLAIVNAYTMRICLSVAITEMVRKQNSTGDDGVKGDTCPVPDSDGSGSNSGGDFEWSESLQGIILGAFFWGYVSYVNLTFRALSLIR
jgi:MFS transporter, ACS family, solute carrier family 17 (sodium-dependent inorganic phosphate cotransporter), other